MNPINYVPEIWNVEKDTIRALIFGVKNGLEYAKEALAEHDSSLGRTTKKNLSWALTIESDIRQMENALELCKKI
jgi:hypothetical protein